MSNFGGQTVFSICYDSITFYDYIYSRLENSEYAEKDGKDEEQEKKERRFKARLMKILEMPTRSFEILVKDELNKKV